MSHSYGNGNSSGNNYLNRKRTEDDIPSYYYDKYAKFDKLGAFQYSKEDGTPAAKLPDQIHWNTKRSRYNKIMEIQQDISRKNLEEKLNREYDVLIEDISFDGKYYIGRTMSDVPDIDGLIYIENKINDKNKTIINKFAKCKIIKVKNYDLIAKLI